MPVKDPKEVFVRMLSDVRRGAERVDEVLSRGKRTRSE
jgi:hypothetical protein